MKGSSWKTICQPAKYPFNILRASVTTAQPLPGLPVRDHQGAAKSRRPDTLAPMDIGALLHRHARHPNRKAVDLLRGDQSSIRLDCPYVDIAGEAGRIIILTVRTHSVIHDSWKRKSGGRCGYRVNEGHAAIGLDEVAGDRAVARVIGKSKVPAIRSSVAGDGNPAFELAVIQNVRADHVERPARRYGEAGHIAQVGHVEAARRD